MKAVTIRPARAADIGEILRLISGSNLSSWSREDLETDSRDSRSFVLVAEREGDIGVCGFAHARSVPSNLAEGGNELEICNIAIDPNSRRKWIGNQLLSELVRRSSHLSPKMIRLEVRASNSNAIRFYGAFGFRTCGIRKSYYEAPAEDALLMSLRPEQRK